MGCAHEARRGYWINEQATSPRPPLGTALHAPPAELIISAPAGRRLRRYQNNCALRLLDENRRQPGPAHNCHLAALPQYTSGDGMCPFGATSRTPAAALLRREGSLWARCILRSQSKRLRAAGRITAGCGDRRRRPGSPSPAATDAFAPTCNIPSSAGGNKTLGNRRRLTFARLDKFHSVSCWPRYNRASPLERATRATRCIRERGVVMVSYAETLPHAGSRHLGDERRRRHRAAACGRGPRWIACASTQ